MRLHSQVAYSEEYFVFNFFKLQEAIRPKKSYSLAKQENILLAETKIQRYSIKKFLNSEG